MKYIVGVSVERFGWVEVEAENDKDAIMKASDLQKSDINFDTDEEWHFSIVEERESDA